jgi:hypothetical protein
MNNNNNYIYSGIIFIVIIIFILIMILLYSKFAHLENIEDEMLSYEVLTPIKGNGKNMNYCLKGCVRGTCGRKNNKNNKNNSNNNLCKYDFQCQYCQDKKTNMFYVNFDDERNIVPLYEEESILNNNQKNLLNNSIIKNNIYINQLNNKIKIMNS